MISVVTSTAAAITTHGNHDSNNKTNIPTMVGFRRGRKAKNYAHVALVLNST